MAAENSLPKGNRVLEEGHRESQNFWKSDLLLNKHLEKALPKAAFDYLNQLAFELGEKAAHQMDALSLTADKNPPVLNKRNRFGENIDEISFHPSYWELMKIAVDSQMMRLKWDPSLREQFKGSRNQMGFALGSLFSMAESGQYCPLCMTDGVALLIDHFAEKADQDRLMPHLFTKDAASFFTGAMFLTEKAGGSDVGANLVRAEKLENGRYALHGEKWFCSNVNAEIIFVLARTDENILGTKGLSLFLVERKLPDGSRNPIEIVRLKDKLGTRSMASGECILNGTIGKMVGEEFRGFYVMTEMINLSRMYNSVAALSAGRRALVEAWQFLNFRKTFGKPVLTHALVRDKLWELGAKQYASFQMVWRSIAAMDKAESGDQDALELLRLLTPMTKRESAEIAVYLCRESMELMGGMGYIEDGVIPKMMRDVMVLPIWEGAGNIMILDMLRVAKKKKGLQLIVTEIEQACASGTEIAIQIWNKTKLLVDQYGRTQYYDQDELEFATKGFFIQLTRYFQMSLLLAQSENNKDAGAQIALDWFMQEEGEKWQVKVPPSVDDITMLIAWDF